MKKQLKPGDLYNAHMAKKKKAEFAPVRSVAQDTKNKNWIAGAIKHPGALRRSLGVKGDKPIPGKKLAAAAKKPGVTGRRARLAQTLKSFHKTQKQYEGSALDNKLDRITGFKEGSKKDEAMDRAIAPHVKGKKGKKMHKKGSRPEKGETKKHERGESKAFEAKEDKGKRRKKKSIPSLYMGATRGLQNIGAQIRQNETQGMQNFKSGKMPYYSSINPLRGTGAAFMKGFQKRRSAKKK